jgi:hypothetical protein
MSYAEEFLKMLNDYHAGKEIYDDDLTIEILQQRIEMTKNPMTKYPPRDLPYFSPSSASSMDLELYMKLLKKPKDEDNHQIHQRRWTKLGTKVGDQVQEDMHFIEKHVKNAPFRFMRTKEGHAAYEEAVKIARKITHKGKSFYLFGKPDGILIHRQNQELVGLEVKSKSTTYSKTGDYAMKEASADHVLQCVAYSLMYSTPDKPLNKFIITYWNVTKKAWNMTDEEIEKYPDLRTFDVTVTDEMREALLDKFVSVLEAAETRNKPVIDLNKFTFCNFKTAIAKEMTDEEFEDVKQQAKEIQKTNLPQYKKQPILDAFFQIKEIRDAHMEEKKND